MVYQYFPGRDAITRALITRETNAFLAELGAPRPANNGVEQIKAMITTAVTHQLKRPALARLLDIEEERLPLGSDVEAARGQMRTAVAEVINAPEFAGRLRHPKEADDLLAIVKGMVDAAGQGGEKDADDLCQRVERAVFGYLGVAAM